MIRESTLPGDGSRGATVVPDVARAWPRIVSWVAADIATLEADSDRDPSGGFALRQPAIILVLLLSGCSSGDPVNPTGSISADPFGSVLRADGGAFALSRLGSQTSPPFVTLDNPCRDTSPHRSEIADTVYFNGDGTFRFVNQHTVWLGRGEGYPEMEND